MEKGDGCVFPRGGCTIECFFSNSATRCRINNFLECLDIFQPLKKLQRCQRVILMIIKGSWMDDWLPWKQAR